MENAKKYKSLIIITTLITLLPILFGLIIWNKLPDQIATHWGADGQADGYSGKTFAVFGMPCILAVLQLFVSFITLNDPKKCHYLRGRPWHGNKCRNHRLHTYRYPVRHLRQLYAETAAELYRRHPSTLDAEQYRELEPHPQAGRKNVYTRRISPDHHRLARQRNGRLRNTCRSHRNRSDLRGSAGSVFVLAIQKRGINSGFI